MEYNRGLWWEYMRAWGIACLVFFIAASAAGFTLANMNISPEVVFPLLLAVLFLPFVTTAIFGFARGYSMAWRYGYVWRGAVARVMNTAWIVIYLVIVAWAIGTDAAKWL